MKYLIQDLILSNTKITTNANNILKSKSIKKISISTENRNKLFIKKQKESNIE